MTKIELLALEKASIVLNALAKKMDSYTARKEAIMLSEIVLKAKYELQKLNELAG